MKFWLFLCTSSFYCLSLSFQKLTDTIQKFTRLSPEYENLIHFFQNNNQNQCSPRDSPEYNAPCENTSDTDTWVVVFSAIFYRSYTVRRDVRPGHRCCRLDYYCPRVHGYLAVVADDGVVAAVPGKASNSVTSPLADYPIVAPTIIYSANLLFMN